MSAGWPPAGVRIPLALASTRKMAPPLPQPQSGQDSVWLHSRRFHHRSIVAAPGRGQSSHHVVPRLTCRASFFEPRLTCRANWELTAAGHQCPQLDAASSLPPKGTGLQFHAPRLTRRANWVLVAAWLQCPQLDAASSLPPKGTGRQSPGPPVLRGESSLTARRGSAGPPICGCPRTASTCA